MSVGTSRFTEEEIQIAETALSEFDLDGIINKMKYAMREFDKNSRVLNRIFLDAYSKVRSSDSLYKTHIKGLGVSPEDNSLLVDLSEEYINRYSFLGCMEQLNLNSIAYKELRLHTCFCVYALQKEMLSLNEPHALDVGALNALRDLYGNYADKYIDAIRCAHEEAGPQNRVNSRQAKGSQMSSNVEGKRVLVVAVIVTVLLVSVAIALFL
jgi:hypothetical protein